MQSVFKFKQFDLLQNDTVMKVGTDGLLLGAWVAVDHKTNILDIGTGSGVLPLMMAQRNQNATIVGIDIDENSHKLAAENFQNSKFSNIISHHCSLQDFQSTSMFDLIVSNPPFFSGGTLSDNGDRNRMRQTVKLSHQDLLMNVKRLLTEDGDFSLVLPHLEGLRFIEMAAMFNLYCNKITEVIPKADKSVERILINFTKHKKEPLTDKIIIEKDKRNDWTAEYIQLTKEYHINL